MAFLMKSMLSNQVKNLGLGGGGEESKEESGPSDPAAAAGMTREEYEEYQKQIVEEKMERDAAFAQKKAERACLRVHLREKYRLPKVRQSHNRDLVHRPILKQLQSDLLSGWGDVHTHVIFQQMCTLRLSRLLAKEIPMLHYISHNTKMEEGWL
ncbi:Complexin-4 [Platysternon megacephalum]|uniref:Complexin-4 n=3 Tax=Durocryptodira TaxID=1579337 RepID=A0A4D9EN33_9SAUR|nr:Complexin-4 [Platysternon megacephalum]